MKKTQLQQNEYKCDSCGKIYEKGLSDEEAEKEVKEIWGEIPQNERVIVCDDCFNRRTPEQIKIMGNEYKKSRLLGQNK